MTLDRQPVVRVAHDALVRVAIDTFTSHALIVTDNRGVITSWSGGAQHLFGFSAHRVVGQSVALIIVPDTDEPSARHGIVAWLEELYVMPQHRDAGSGGL